jgi:hypothetical protein
MYSEESESVAQQAVNRERKPMRGGHKPYKKAGEFSP